MSQIRQLPREFQGGGELRLSVEQYDEMIRRGIISEDLRYELIDGKIVAKNRAAVGEAEMSIGDLHIYAVDQLGEFKREATPLGVTLRTQQPIVIDDLNKPESDAYLIAGSNDDYIGREVRPADVLAVIEAAESSLKADRTTKLRLYANAGIRLYIILNLVDKVAQLYTDPQPGRGHYATVQTLSRKQTLSIPLLKRKALKLPLSKLIAAG